MENPHDTDGFDNLTENEQRIKLLEYAIDCHKGALGIMKRAGVALVSELVMTREIGKLERSLTELRSR